MYADLHVRAPALAATVSEVAAAAEEAGEEIERVMLAGLTALFVLVEAIVSVLVVDAPGFCRGEGVVGFGYRDEFVMGGVVTSVCLEILANGSQN